MHDSHPCDAWAAGADLLPESAVPYFGLIPVVLGARAAWGLRRRGSDVEVERPGSPVGVMTVAAITLANGADNIGVYVPVFATVGLSGTLTYLGIFLIGVALWCFFGWLLVTRRLVASAISRWGHIALPVVLIAIGLAILIEGNAFGL